MIHIGSAENILRELTASRRTIIITDTNIKALYPEFISQWQNIVIGQGEGIKTLDTVGMICAELLALEADRSVLLVGIGGGIVTDIVGFVASTYMRGVDFGFVSTTLVGQVDASIGGKNGVNLNGYKNIVGTFNLPKFIIADPDMLSTLPERELRAAMGEVIKYALIEDPTIMEIGERAEIIKHCMSIKKRIVEADFREGGERKLLNLGHTFGHAIEKSLPEHYLHGEAVAIGICIASRISTELGLLDRENKEKIVEHIAKLGLPTTCPDVTIVDLAKIVLSDKKRKGDTIDMILLDRIGHALIYPISINKLQEICSRICPKADTKRNNDTPAMVALD